MTKDVFAAIAERRSVRRFSGEAVADATITRILEAALQAPSAGNLQPWKFYVVKKQESKKALGEAAWQQEFIASAPVVIVVSALPELVAAHYGPRGRDLYVIQDTAAAIMNLLLAAHAVGLGSCWVGAFLEKEVRRIIGAGEDELPVAIIPLGYAAEESAKPARRSLNDCVVILD
ncbi:nitroreductase family protein [Carboxydocella sp. ULO1]|uniref:nitroreductase family protein n=1 Tax=Carboxydocella sp. ULO1 TaxID=1926599 RepID=UPI0009ACAC4C|nr:nitroreductase family protein [Carboxydocella sp. ULO1]GAW28467.1 NADH dehydrogenase [Carboxydocella sp. ULO1]